MVKYEKYNLIVNGKVIKCFKFEIRNVIEHGGEFIVLLEIPFDNNIEKNNILRVDGSGNVVWTLREDWLYATDFYARRFKIDIRTGKIVDMTISK